MKTVWLLRHAKSSWEDGALADRDRPLAPRGKKAAKRIRRYASDTGVRPQLVLCSSAERARATLDIVLTGLGEPLVEIDDVIYMASADSLLRRIQSLDPGLERVMLVGHNPGLHELTCLLAPPGPDLFPTGALAELRLGGDEWHSAGPGSATLDRLVLPRSLTP
jgi:phosphohistidine phosphatase